MKNNIGKQLDDFGINLTKNIESLKEIINQTEQLTNFIKCADPTNDCDKLTVIHLEGVRDKLNGAIDESKDQTLSLLKTYSQMIKENIC